MLIERETTATAPPAPRRTGADRTRPILRTASLGGTNGLDAMKNIFDMTWTAVTEANGQSAIASTLTNSAIDAQPE